MPRDKINNLNDILFAQLERLDDEELTDEQLEKEIRRANAITSISDEILTSAKLSLDAAKMMNEYGDGKKVAIPYMLTDGNETASK